MPTLRPMTNEDLLAYKHLCSVCYIYPDTSPAEELPEEKLREQPPDGWTTRQQRKDKGERRRMKAVMERLRRRQERKEK